MWEYERVRGLILQIDATLDTDAPALHVQVRVRNPRDRESGMYWWTNIAIAQTAGSRVFAPAMRAYRTGYDGRLQSVDLAEADPRRPSAAPAAADYFFDLAPGLASDPARGLAPGPEAERASVPEPEPTSGPALRQAQQPVEGSARPWIAALDADGSGLAHVSTAPLTGRKLFVWGDTPGGRRWCDWLGGETGAYFEIQAGLATTQYEHLRMPGGATWDWTETFLPLRVEDPRTSGAWGEAIAAVGAEVSRAAEALGSVATDRLRAAADSAPAELLSTGSPWGALEQEVAARFGSPFVALPGVRFSREGAEGAYWAGLLDKVDGTRLPETRRATDGVDRAGRADALDRPGADPAGRDRSAGADAALADPDPSIPPASYVVGEEWDRLLAEAPATWLTHYHRAVAAHAGGEHGTAVSHYEASLRLRRSPWALRGLGLALRQSDRGSAAQAEGIARLVEARDLAPELAPLARELTEALLADGKATEARALLDGLPPALRTLGRFRVVAVRAALAAGDRETAGRILEEGIEVPDLREGELSMSALWHEAFHDRPVPTRYDFEMSPEA